jgi:hypothetical protein
LRWRRVARIIARTIITGFLIATTFVFFFVGTLFLPYQIIPSNKYTDWISSRVSQNFNPPSQPSVVSSEILLPFIKQPPIYYNITQGNVMIFYAYTVSQPLELVFNLTGNLIVGQNLTLTVTMDMPASLLGAYDWPIVTVSLDDALAYPFATKQVSWGYLNSCPSMDISCFLNFGTPSFSRLVFNTNESKNVNQMGPWTESQPIEYTVSGSFGATVDVYPPVFSRASQDYGFVQTFHTQTLYTISGQETVVNRRNAEYSTGLALYIIALAFLEITLTVITEWPKPRGNDSHNKNVNEYRVYDLS